MEKRIHYSRLLDIMQRTDAQGNPKLFSFTYVKQNGELRRYTGATLSSFHAEGDTVNIIPANERSVIGGHSSDLPVLKGIIGHITCFHGCTHIYFDRSHILHHGIIVISAFKLQMSMIFVKKICSDIVEVQIRIIFLQLIQYRIVRIQCSQFDFGRIFFLIGFRKLKEVGIIGGTMILAQKGIFR